MRPRDSRPAGFQSGRQQRAIIGGTPVDLVDRTMLLEAVAAALRTRRPLAVASVNLDHIHHFGTKASTRLRFEPPPLDWLCVIDGAPVAVRARQLTGRRWPRLTGADLLEPLLSDAESGGWRVGFLGGLPATHEKLRARLKQSYPSLQLAGCWAPDRAALTDPARTRELAQSVRAARTDLLVVSLGKPRQEIWIEQHGLAAGASVMLAFGAAADFFAGAVTRAPAAFRVTGVEWLYRLAREPRRLGRRYLLQGPRAALRLLR